MNERPNYRLQVDCDCCGAKAGEFCKSQRDCEDAACLVCRALAAATARGDLYCAGGLRELVNMFDGDLDAVAHFRVIEAIARLKRKGRRKMGQKSSWTCDAAECTEAIEGPAEPCPKGWVRRDIVDSIGPAAPGEGEFSGHQRFMYCPKHAGLLVLQRSPLLSPTVLAELGRRDDAEKKKPQPEGGSK